LFGDVPAHWEVLPFTKYVADRSDYRGKTPEKTEAGVFLVTAKNVRMGFIDYETSQEYVAADEYDEIMRRGLPKKGDILFTTEAPLGNVALVDREDVALAQRIIRFRMSPTFFASGFTLYAMMSDHFQVQLQSLSTGSTAEGLKASKLPILRIVAPPLEEQNIITSFLDREIVKIDQLVTKAVTVIFARHEVYDNSGIRIVDYQRVARQRGATKRPQRCEAFLARRQMIAVHNANAVPGTQARLRLSRPSQHWFQPSHAADDERPRKRWLGVVDLVVQRCQRHRQILARLRSCVYGRLKSHRHDRHEIHRGRKQQLSRVLPLSMLFK
jgi:hypothetical protein